MEAIPAGQLTFTIRCDASVYVVRGGQGPPPVPPPVVPAVPPAPDAPAAPSGLTSELLLEQPPASASSAARAVLRPIREPDTMCPQARITENRPFSPPPRATPAIEFRP